MLKRLANSTFHKYRIGDHKYYLETKDIAYGKVKEYEAVQLANLNRLLDHAYRNTAYYGKGLSKFTVNGSVTLNDVRELKQFPILTKDDVRANGEDLYSKDHVSRCSLVNTSGGSTGAPIKVLQDKYYGQSGSGAFLFVKELRTGDPYSDVVRLWGAHRDQYGGKNSMSGYMKEYVNNTKLFNSAKLTPESIQEFVTHINKHRPSMILAYVQSIYEVAVFAKANGLEVLPQKSIHTGAGKLYPFMRELIEEVFSTKVFDHYGGREFGAVATECGQGSGMHVLGHQRIVEILDEDGNECPPGKEGDVILTVLNNFSMPLIRYKVGDRAVWSDKNECACGIVFPKIEKIVGRTANNFPLANGGFVSGEYLTLTFNHVPGIGNFQIRQKSYEEIQIFLIIEDNYDKKTETKISDKMRKLFGTEATVDFIYVDAIPKTPTGKHLFTVSEIIN